MIEVLKGLRYRFAPPVGTSVDVEGSSSQQEWIWHTGEVVILQLRVNKAHLYCLVDQHF